MLGSGNQEGSPPVKMDGKTERAMTHEQARKWVNFGNLSCSLCGLTFANGQGVITHIRRICIHKLEQGKWDEVSRSGDQETTLKRQKTLKDYFAKGESVQQGVTDGTSRRGQTSGPSSSDAIAGPAIDLTASKPFE